MMNCFLSWFVPSTNLVFMKVSSLITMLFHFYGLIFVAHAESSAEKIISFQKDIKPIFQANCNGCHQPAKMKGDYLMTEFVALLEGERPEKSQLFLVNRKTAIYLIRLN